jgi:hypothetical protein
VDHPLDDCRTKVARAKEQFDALRDEIIEFTKDKPYTARIYVDSQTGDEVFEAPEPPRFPKRWAAIFGEITHNCRSALDYLVTALVEEAGREPDGNNAFPISKSRTGYLTRNKGGITYRDRLLNGIPEPLKEKIDKFQPYERGDLAHADVLLALKYLADRDKHRKPHPAYAWINMPTKAFLFPMDTEYRNVSIRLPRKGGLQIQADFHGMKRGRAGFVVYPDVKVQRLPGVEVVFGRDPGKVIGMDDLVGLIKYVEVVVESFAGDFKP